MLSGCLLSLLLWSSQSTRLRGDSRSPVAVGEGRVRSGQRVRRVLRETERAIVKAAGAFSKEDLEFLDWNGVGHFSIGVSGGARRVED